MREQLIQYVNLLFAGIPESDDIKQEILQNTLDRYDDLIDQGKAPEAAYRLAISGIGDVNEILGSTAPGNHSAQSAPHPIQDEAEDKKNKQIRAVGIVMYILCAVPLLILDELGHSTLGLCLTLALVATATYLMIITKGKDETEPAPDHKTEGNPVKAEAGRMIRLIALTIFLVISFLTGAWYITWIIFPIAGCIRGLVFAIIDLKEENTNET